MKKIIILASIIMYVLMLANTYANSIIHTIKETEEISTGTMLSKYELLTNDGWVVANVIEIDTNDEYTNVVTLVSDQGVAKLASTMSMTKNKGAIVGINGDFFSGVSGKGHSIGILAENHRLMTSATSENDSRDKFATLYLNDKNEPFYEYLKNDIHINVGGERIKVSDINKYSTDLSVPTIYTPEWGEKSYGSNEELYCTEFVIDDGECIEIRDRKEGAVIPKNGFVIIIEEKANQLLKSLISVGTKVSYDTGSSFDIEKIKFAISGGAKLVDNGQIPESFSHNITGRNPRTAIGTNKDGNKIYLVTVDGRISTSIGMTQEELAEFLKRINIYNAINLDGGGSTTMVARRLGNTNLTEINTPSGGTERLVANGVGVVSTAPESEKLEELVIKVDNTNIFVHEKAPISVIGLNKYKAPIEIDSGDVSWDYDGVDVKIEDGTIIGDVVGEVTVIARIGKIKATKEINILSDVNEIFISPKSRTIEPGEKVWFNMQAKNRNGYYAKTDDTTFEENIYKYYKNEKEEEIPEDAIFEGHMFTANTAGTYILSIKKGNCTTFAKVVIKSQKFIALDDFEEVDYYFDPYPDEVGGNTSISNEFYYSGKSSVKLDYDFDRDAKVRGAYIVMNEPIIVPKEANSIAFRIFSENYKDEKLKIKMLDGNGDTRIIILQDNIPECYWKEVVYNIRNYTLPLKITDIYLAQNDENIRSKGSIYVDNFGYYTNTKDTTDIIDIPKDVKLEDANNTSIRGSKSYDIAFLNDFSTDTHMINWLKNQKMIDSINNTADLLVFIDSISDNKEKYAVSGESIVDDVDKYSVSYNKMLKETIENNGYRTVSKDDCTIIMMDISQNSIRKSDGDQYANIVSDINGDETDNIVIVLNNTIDKFTDLKERKAFVDMLCELKRSTKKNIIVVHSGFFQDYSLERGVKFLSVNNTINKYEDYSKSEYLVLSIAGKETSYEYKRIFE